MLKSKAKSEKRKMQNRNNLQFRVLNFTFWFCALLFTFYAYAFAQEAFVYDAKGKRNPFVPLVTSDGRLLRSTQEEEKGNLLLEGIVYDKRGSSYAIVNSEIVKVSDKVGDFQVLKIQENKVIFIKEGEPLEIELKKEEE